MFNEEAKLRVVTVGKNANGFVTGETVTEYPCYVLKEKSVTRSEVYLAGSGGGASGRRADIVPKIILVIRLEDWEETKHVNQSTGKREYATQIEYDGGVYDILRDYRNERSTIELTVG